MTDQELRRQLLDFEIGLDAASSDEVVDYDWGRAFLSASLPLVWDASWLAIEEPGMKIGEVTALADRVLGEAGFEHRTVVPCDEADGRRLVSEAPALPGWGVELVDYMVWREDSGRLPQVEVREVALEEIEPLRRELVREFLPGGVTQVEATVDQLLELDRRYGTATDLRWFAAAAAGKPAAACCLFSAEEIGQVEEVATAAAARRHGLGQAIVLTALAESRAAGQELTFLSADAEDWPKQMYEKLGFAKVGEVHVLRRAP